MAVYFILSAWSGTQSPDAGPAGTSSSGAPSSGAPSSGAPSSGTPSSGPEALPPVVMTWGGMIVGAVVLAAAGVTGLAPLAASSADVTLLNHQVSWLVPVLGLSVLAAAFAYVTGIAAARRLGAKLGSFVALAEVLFATAFAWVLLHQVPTATQFLGGALILAGVVLVRLDES
jgi:drug/metabolite transporter (DMT)-like permease